MTNYLPDQILENVQGLLGGLAVQMEREPTIGLQSGYASGGAPACENVAVPTHCFRTVSQRSLSTPTLFLSQAVAVGAGLNITDLITFGVAGALPGATATSLGGAAINFNDGNVQPQRARVDDLVLIGLRSRTTVYVLTNNVVAAPFDVGSLVESVADFVKNSVVLRIYHTSDVSDPWVDSTPLAYFERPAGEFVAVPPVIWKDRDPKMQIQGRAADFGAAAGAMPNVQVPFNTIAGASILIEAIFVPNPDQCGPYWPGQSCPKNRIKGMSGYVGK